MQQELEQEARKAVRAYLLEQPMGVVMAYAARIALGESYWDLARELGLK